MTLHINSPSNPSDGDTYRDENGIQWAYIEEVSDWGIDLSDPDTNKRYHSIDHLPNGEPVYIVEELKDDIVGYESVMRALNEH